MSFLIKFINEELVANAEVFSQILVNEGHVIVDLANFKDFLATQICFFIPVFAFAHIIALIPLAAELACVPTIFDISEQLNTDFIWIVTVRCHRHRTAMMIGKVDDFRII
ncbi:hypothetical protein D3C72_2052260 [compost metagenome]